MKNSIKERSKKVPLRTKIEVFFSMEYLKLTNSSSLLSKESLEYGSKKTSELIEILNKAPDEIQSVIEKKQKKKVRKYRTHGSIPNPYDLNECGGFGRKPKH